MGNEFSTKKLISACDDFLTDLISDTQYTKALRLHVTNLRSYALALLSDNHSIVRLTLDEIGPVADLYAKIKTDY